ncbi:coiled-coil domain-containing protein 113-like isoform X1 [Phyllopteryx taeniolatus]|uniref:coiled-coil domain-containing protein 113-like isoform X1 n=1 Tax=Phyllopteryx taeniolatus TaxID=161469 RepID=UPI002AD31F32|nr:coiled-coil domain-containing protein 113-like isoform X1 [Phyllopteryx taeniolatus]
MEKKSPQERQEGVYARIQLLQSSNAALLAENELFESFVIRLDRQDPLTQPVAGTTQLEDRGQCWRQRSQGNLLDSLLQLTLGQKLHVAQREIAEMIRDQQKDKERSERILNNYKVSMAKENKHYIFTSVTPFQASLKEIDLQRADIRRDKNDFEHRFLKPLKKMSEMKEPLKLLQYIRSKQASQSDKLKLKIQGLKEKEKRLQQQLQEKRELGKAGLEDIFLEYSEPTIDIEELQVKHLRAQRTLSAHKEKLQRVTQEFAQLSRDITKRKEMLEKIEEDILLAEEERSKAEDQNTQLRRQMSTYQAPDIAQYMHIKDMHKRLQQRVHTWQRKVGIAEMTSKSKAWSQHRGTSVVSAEAGTVDSQCPDAVKLPYIAQHGKS